MDELVKISRENQRNMSSLTKVFERYLEMGMSQLAASGVPYPEAAPASAPSPRPPSASGSDENE
jgi:hypothetical protein